MIGKLENPAAFPKPEGEFNTGADGMTLRDYFAGQALVRIIYEVNIDTVAETAYAYADRMLKQRESK